MISPKYEIKMPFNRTHTTHKQDTLLWSWPWLYDLHIRN